MCWALLPSDADKVAKQNQIECFTHCKTLEGLNEVGILNNPSVSHDNQSDGSPKTVIRIDPRYFRPTEVEILLGDATKAREKLGWTPKISFEELVAEMVKNDYEISRKSK